MATKFVQNTAGRMGVSVEHAEKVWHDAKAAVKKGKRQGSWYWGKVVNTFKRMMGVKEHITFTEFQELLAEEQVEEGVKDVTLPKGMMMLPKKIMIGIGGYYLQYREHSPTVAYFDVKRLLDEDPGMYISISKRGTALSRSGTGVGSTYMLQAHGQKTSNMTWEQRSKRGSYEVVKPFDTQSIKEFMTGVLAFAGMLKDA